MIKKLIGAALAATLALGVLSGCGSSAAAGKDLLEQVKASGKLVVGMNAEFAPYEFHAMVDGKDTVSGFDVELAKEIAKDLGVELEIKEMDFDPLITSLKAEQVDVVISGMAMTEKRKEQADFSDPYYTGDNVLVMNKNNTEGMNTLEDLASKNIGIQQSSTQDTMAKNELEPLGCKPTYISSMNTLLLSLKAGQLDGIITDDTVCRMMVLNNPELVINDKLQLPIESEDESSVGVVLRPGSDTLKAEINKTIKRLKDSGQMEEFVDAACELAAANASAE